MDAAHQEIAIAVAQFAPTESFAQNLVEMGGLSKIAAARGARLIVFPEYSSSFTSSLGPHSVVAAQHLDGQFVAGLKQIAKNNQVYLVAGMLEATADPARASNTLVAVDPQGVVVAAYRKLHLYDAFGCRESDYVAAGSIEAPETFEVDGMRLGLQTCYDLRFPEVTRRLVDAGAELIVLPAQWVRGTLKEHHWRTLITARAIENTIYVAAADQAAPTGVGNSMIVDPMGVELVSIGEQTDVAVAWVSRARIAAVRDINPALQLRRFDVVPR